MKNYSTARAFISLMELIGWLLVALGLLFFAITFSRGFLGAVTLMASISIAGLAIITVVQIARAQIDTAENTSRMAGALEGMLRKQQAADDASRARDMTSSPAPQAATRKPPIEDEVAKTHRGQRIIRSQRGYLAVGEIHADIPAAVRAIDRVLEERQK